MKHRTMMLKQLLEIGSIVTIDGIKYKVLSQTKTPSLNPYFKDRRYTKLYKTK